VAREIAVLLYEHRALAHELGEIDTGSLSIEGRRDLLTYIKSSLGIRPFRRRHLGYVGP